MFLKILMDNNSCDPFLDTEHGFSAVVDSGGRRLILDTGAGGALLQNSERMDIRIDPVDPLVLSHAHYDHAGGVPHLIRTGWRGKMYTGSGFFLKKGKMVDGAFADIGPGFNPELLSDAGIEHIVVGDPLELLPGITLFGGLRAAGNGYFYIRRGGDYIHDPFSDELHLHIRKGDVSALITGCAHCGIVNILKEANRMYPETPVREIYGGFHLSGLPDEMVRSVGKEIIDSGVRKAGVCHCSGNRLPELLPEGPFFPIYAGSVVELLS